VAHNKSNKKVANGLVAMSSAAVLAVYAAGYVRTRPAANRLAAQVYERPLMREAAGTGAAPEVSVPPLAPNRAAVAPTPALPAHSEPKHTAAVTPATTASAAPASVAVPNQKTETVAAPAESAAPVAAAAAVAPATADSPATAVATSQPQVEAPAAPAPPPPPAPPVWKDGKYTAWGTCRHGDIQATVVIEGGRIKSAEITDCQTRYSCDVIETLPPKVITRQKNKFDAVGGATESAYAYYGAVYWALDQASK